MFGLTFFPDSSMKNIVKTNIHSPIIRNTGHITILRFSPVFVLSYTKIWDNYTHEIINA
jgi:hypothetical protein